MAWEEKVSGLLESGEEAELEISFESLDEEDPFKVSLSGSVDFR
jgi:hypothetical protein